MFLLLLIYSSYMIRSECNFLTDLNLCTDCTDNHYPCVTLWFLYQLFVVWQPMTSDFSHHCYQMVIPAQVVESLKVHSMHRKCPMCFSPPLPPIKQSRWWLHGRRGLCLQTLVFAFVCAQLSRLYPSSANWPSFVLMSLFVSLTSYILHYICGALVLSVSHSC